jgi:hypothetical protein
MAARTPAIVNGIRVRARYGQWDVRSPTASERQDREASCHTT